jgi:outer membrane biosynthesis protein TonB
MVLPLRVWSDEQAGDALAAQWAHTIEISDIGCRLGGLRTELSPGQTITLQRGQQKATFRVIWSKHLAANENQAGIEALDYGVNIWAVNLPSATESEDGVVDATPAPVAITRHTQKAAPSSKQTLVLASAWRRFRWSAGICGLLFCLALGMSSYGRVFYQSGHLTIQPQVLVPPTARDFARLTPKPHIMPFSLTKPLDVSESRVRVAEAPTGHVVYPVAPDDSISGTVRLQIVIAASGLVKQIHVLSGKQPLAEAAAQAVRLWHYGSFDGTDKAVERETSVTVSFLGTDAVSLQFPSSKTQIGSRSKDN